MENQSLRCFVAINLPSSIKENLGRIQEELRKANADVSWVKPQNIHVTLKFLGDVGEKRIERVKEVLARAVQGISPFSLILEGLGVFPGLKAPRVVWIGAKESPVALLELQKAVEDGLAQIGFPKEKRKFSPHFTLGRVRSPRNLEALRNALAKFTPPPSPLPAVHPASGEGVRGWGFLGEAQVESLELMRSQLSPQGSQYTVIQQYLLLKA